MSDDTGSSKSTAPSSSTSEPMSAIWLGIGSPRPQARVKQNSMFGHVVDAFDEKSIVKIGEVTPYEKRKKAAEEMQKAAEAAAVAAAAAEEEKEEKKDDGLTQSTSTGAPETDADAGEAEKAADAAETIDTSPVNNLISESVSGFDVWSINIRWFSLGLLIPVVFVNWFLVVENRCKTSLQLYWPS